MNAPIRNLYRVEMFADMLAEQHRKNWIIDGVFGFGELSVVYGAPGDGKSVIIGDAACHVAAGLPWFGRPVDQVAVLYVALERAGLVRRRFAAWAKHHRVVSLPLAVIDGGLDLVRSSDDVKKLYDTVREVEWPADVDLFWIIIDTKARAMGSGDENAAKDMNALVANIDRLRRMTGAHVTLIDHVPHHDKTRIRGHGALLGAADATFRVSKGVTGRVFEIDKVNDGPDEIRFGFELKSVVVHVDEGDGQETTAPVVVPTDAPSPKASATRTLSSRQKLAVEALAEAVLSHGQAVPPSFGLPSALRAAPILVWRDEVERRGIISPDVKNRRGAFFDLKNGLAARRIIGARDDLAWLA